ncbi:MAG: glycosyltransferase family protein [Candidatus Thorarchaeota archaeon]
MGKSVVYYISDHGLGHATRSLAIIKALCKEENDLRISIRTSRNANLMKNALSNEDIPIYEEKNDFGLIQGDSLSISSRATKRAFEEWMHSWQKWLRQEYQRLKNRVDLLISDICPQPFLLAEKLGIPSIAISNFTWLDQYKQILESDRLLELEQAYNAASSALILPFNMEMAGIRTNRKKEIALVFRPPTRDLSALQSQYRPLKDKRLMFIRAEGGSLAYSLSLNRWKVPNSVIFVTGSRNVEGMSKQIFWIPTAESNHQDFVMASELIVTKAGYSILSEAVAARIPLILIETAGFPEAATMSEQAVSLGIAQLHSMDSLLRATWLDKQDELDSLRNAYNHLPRRYTENGIVEAIEHILEYLRD